MGNAAGRLLKVGSIMEFIFSSNRISTSLWGSVRMMPLKETYVFQDGSVQCTSKWEGGINNSRTSSHNLFTNHSQSSWRLSGDIYLKLKCWIWERMVLSHSVSNSIERVTQHHFSAPDAIAHEISASLSLETHLRSGKTPCSCKSLNFGPKMKSEFEILLR